MYIFTKSSNQICYEPLPIKVGGGEMTPPPSKQMANLGKLKYKLI